MASTYSQLKIELIGTGDQSGTWGDTTNTNLGTALEEAITGSADVTFASGTVTLTLTDTNTTQTARNLRLNLTGTSGGAQNLIVPAIEKLYLVNNGCADAITVKNSTGTGIAVPAGKSMFLFNTGSNVVNAVTYITGYAASGANSDITSLSGLTTPLSIGQGGTGATTLAGANIAVTTAANTFTNTQTFNGTSAILASKFTNGLEKVTVSATAATGTIDYDVTTQSVLYYTSNASANWTVNFRASSGTSLNTAMSTGEVITVVFLVQQGSTAYYNNVVQIDGSTVTPVYDGQVAWSSGNANALDAYTYTIIKTGSATFKVLALQSAFA